ncbi:SRPBCC domain-containing protein [Agromyces sp. MMS24-JH15]|uniref:SRPBCC family protein n=1 Tax=Agromyces sp. MMS24-JH15 TaxID=3243765 RepID=UPI00374898E0
MSEQTTRPGEGRSAERPDAVGFEIVRVFDAPRELVWQLWTTEADAEDWWHPRGIEIKPGSVRVDARPGGEYAYTMVNPADGSEYPTAGVYREVSPFSRLVFTWGGPDDDDADRPLITVDLDDLGDGRTGMRFRVDGVAAGPGDDMYDGWASAHDVLAERLADAQAGAA